VILITRKFKLTENPLRNSIHNKNKRIDKIILDTETGQQIYDE
jgi:hypothetical protein